MTDVANKLKAATARIGARAAELMVEYPDWSVDQCLATAQAEEWFVYGDPESIDIPKGVLNS